MKLLLAFVLTLSAWPAGAQTPDPSLYGAMRWRTVGPYRGGRAVAAAGVPQQPKSVTPLGLIQQFTLGTKLADTMSRTFAVISASPKPSALSPPSAAPSPNAALLALNSDLATAYDLVEGADRAPTSPAAKAVAHLEQRMKALLKGTP